MFIVKQVVFLALAGVIVVGVSLLSPRGVRRLALVGCLVAIALTALTLVHGVEIKGARRWIALPGMSCSRASSSSRASPWSTAWLLSRGQARPRASPAC